MNPFQSASNGWWGDDIYFEQVSKGALAMSTSHNGHDPSHSEHVEEAPMHEEQESGGLNKTVATVAVVAVGAALFETALLPGLALGVAAVAAPKFLPKLGSALNPLFKSTVRGTYKFAQKSREMFAEAKEQVHDTLAEVKAEAEAAKDAAAERPAA
jgi:Protein of unknown function (DUF5132)